MTLWRACSTATPSECSLSSLPRWRCRVRSESELQQSLGIAPENSSSLRARQIKLVNELDWALVSHSEAVITAQHHPLHTYLFDDEFHDQLGVAHGVVREALQVGTGSLRQVL